MLVWDQQISRPKRIASLPNEDRDKYLKSNSFSFLVSARYVIFGPLNEVDIACLVKVKILTFMDYLCTNYHSRKREEK